MTHLKTVILTLAVSALLCVRVIGAETALPPNLDASVANGLQYLARQQQPDGSFEASGQKVTTTGLALMSFLAAGHVPDLGRYGMVVRNATDFLIAQAPEDGYFGKVDGSRMYGHGMVTLALAEVYGVEPSEARRAKLRPVLVKAANVILTAQAVAKAAPYAGGWRYEPAAVDSDLSLSGWHALALRACQDSGLDVPKSAVQKAAAFVLQCYRADLKAFAYQPGGDVTPSTCGVAALSLYLLDSGSRPQVAEAIKYLTDHPVTPATRFFHYTLYYNTQAAYQAGDAAWVAVSKNTFALLLPLQQKDGGWPASTSTEEPGRIYSTSMSLLTLTVPYRLLPIYQR